MILNSFSIEDILREIVVSNNAHNLYYLIILMRAISIMLFFKYSFMTNENIEMKIFSFLILILTAVLISACTNSEKTNDKIYKSYLWSRSDKSYNNFRIPSLIVTPRKTVLAFCEGREGGDSGDIDILLKRSVDNGKSWSEQMVVWDDSNNTCGNPCPVIDRVTGRIILFMTWNLGSDHETIILRNESKSTRIPYICYSDDDGVTWSEPENLIESCKNPVWDWYATGPGIGIQLSSEQYRNRLVIPCNNSYYDDTDEAVRENFGYGSHVLISDDYGKNWRMSEIITPKVNESQIVELSTGILLMNMRSYHSKACRAVSFSRDGGETWSEVQHASQLVESVCQASILDYGKYNEKNMFLFSNPSVPIHRTHMTIKTSFDDCKTWSNSKLVYSGPSAYSCLAKLSDGNIGLLFEAGESNPYENIVFLSFTPEILFSPGSLIDSVAE